MSELKHELHVVIEGGEEKVYLLQDLISSAIDVAHRAEIIEGYTYIKEWNSRKDTEKWYCTECKEFVKVKDSLGDICCCKCDLVIASYKR